MPVKVKDVLDALQQMQKSLECSICLELLKDPHSTKCNHQFCGQCIRQVLEKSSRKSKNKWYCPLCKTPVSKRSLTPNPKLNEIVAAVRNLQGAVQEDTGIPTGSPPQQPYKSSCTAGTSGYFNSSTHHPTPQKHRNNSKGIQRKVTKKDQFNVYTDSDENHTVENRQPQVVSNVNIRSTLGPRLTQTTVNITKSKKASITITTRRTRNSRKIAQESHPEETLNGRSVSEDLLHMIDTMPFQPVSKGDATCPTQDEAQVALESGTDQADEVSHDPSKTKETVSTVNSRQPRASSNETCQSVPVHPEKTSCLTTIAEADSSIRTSPCDSVAFCGNKDPSQRCAVTTTHEKEDERAVSSTKFDCPASSLDTMQSVSILASLDYDAVPDDTLEDRQEGTRKDEDASNKDINEVSTEISDAGNEKEPFLVCQGQQTNDYEQSFQTVNKNLPSENIASTVEDHETQNVGFEGLVSLFDESSLSKLVDASQKAVETAKVHPDLSKIGKEAISPRRKGRGLQDALVPEATESDLYERVKQRQRRRPSEMSQQSNRRSDFPKLKTIQLKRKTRKRSADAVAVSTRNESIQDGNPRKKLKNSKSPAPHHDSPLMVNAESSQDESGLSTECKEERDVLANGSKISYVTGNDQGGASSLSCHSCSSDNTVLSNEMVPASVSSSGKSIPSVINPMIAHDDQALEDRGAPRRCTENTKEWGSQERSGNDHGEIVKNHTFIEDGLQKATTNEQSPQIKPVQVEQKQMTDETKDKEKAYQDAEFTNCKISSPIQQLFSMALQVDGSEDNGVPNGDEEKSAHVVGTERGSSSQVSVTGRQESLPLEPVESELVTCCDHQRPPFQEDVEEQTTNQSSVNNIQILRNACSSSESVPKQKQLTSSLHNMYYHKETLSRETRITGSEIESKLSHETVEAERKTSGPSSVEADLLDNTPTQSSLDVMDAVTPCLFENDSWETPNRKMSQKKSGNKREPNVASDLSGSNSKIAPRTQTLGLSCKTITEEERIVDKSGFDGTNSLPGGPAESRDAEQQQFSSVARCSDGSTKDLTLDTATEGTQSYGTSQSISVLHDLEFALQELQEDADTTWSEPRDDNRKSSQNVHTDLKGDAPWAEPLPKKPRSGEQLSASRGLNPINVTLEQGIGPSIEKTRDSECTESDVIPPTPPVKPVAKQVFSSRSPMMLSCPKMKLQRKDEACGYSGRLVVKQKRRVKSPRVSNAQDSERDRDGPRNASEDSVSLLNKCHRSPEALNGHAITFSQILESDSNKQSQSSPGKKWSKLENTPYESPTNLKHCVQSISKKQKRNDVSSENINDSNSLQDKDDSHVSQKQRQRVVANLEVKKGSTSLDRAVGEIQESNTSLPYSPAERRVYDIVDSFDWSGTKDKGEGNKNSQDGSVVLIVDDNKDGEHVKGDEKKDENEGFTGGVPGKSVAGNLQQIDDRDCILVRDQSGDFRDGDNDGNPTCTYDGGDSSSDEALLKPVFLAKEFESGANPMTYEEDAEDEEEQETAFSQELIPSENGGEDDDDDGITSSYKALDSTGASSATFLSEAAASTQKMEVLRQDVEEIEREMKELRAYLAKTDEKREEAEDTFEDDVDYQDEDPCDDPDVLPSLTPPPPLTPKSIPAMRQLSSPLKNVSRYLDQEGQSSDEDSDCEDLTRTNEEEHCELRKTSRNEEIWSVGEKEDVNKTCTRKRPHSPNYEDDSLSITAVKNRQAGTPSPPRSCRSKQKSQEKDEKELIVIDDRDSGNSKTGSLLLVKRRKVTDELVPKKSPVVSLLFTRTRKDLAKAGPESPRSVEKTKAPSPVKKKSSPFIYSRKRGAEISPIKRQEPPRVIPRDNASRDRISRKSVSRDECRSPDQERRKLKVVTNAKTSIEKEDNNCGGTGTKHLSFVATRLNRKQLAEARALAETYGGKLASEFNNKTSHVVMATDENMQVTRHSYTMKYLLGLALGKWIVSHHWIAACIQAKALVPEVEYEVKGDPGLGQASIPRLARTARSSKEEALLFEDFDVVCFGEFSAAVTKEQLSQLLKFCGAHVHVDAESLKRIDKDRRKVVVIDKETRSNVDDLKATCRQLNAVPVSLEWVTDSIANYKVQDLRDYVMESY